MEQKERAVLVGVNLKNQENFEYSMDELENLSEACDLEVVGKVTQNLNKINPSYYIGKGKLEDVLTHLRGKDADIVIFNDELSPSQIRNIEGVLECKIIDRTTLILDIFAKRAKTKEAKLQVEVAQLEYMLPRLVGLRDYLSRQGGGSTLRSRGGGETKLELDRRKIEDRIAALNRELENLVAKRQTQRKQRKRTEIPVVSLVGYTNAGKSSIMNRIVGKFNKNLNKKVFAKDMLFATLETSVRRVKLPDNKEFLLTDTVGFVDKLPHNLVKAFRSTLEEAAEADLLIQVVDYSNPHYREQIETTNKTLKEIGIINIPTIYAYNKSDLTDLKIPVVKEDSVYLSAKNGLGIDELIELIKKHIFTDFVQCEMLIPYDKGQIVSYLSENAHILLRTHEEKGTKIKVECKKSDFEKYRDYVI